jgi:hypothetical protein
MINMNDLLVAHGPERRRRTLHMTVGVAPESPY